MERNASVSETRARDSSRLDVVPSVGRSVDRPPFERMASEKNHTVNKLSFIAVNLI